MTQPLPSGVYDALSCFHVGSQPTAAANGATSGIDRGSIQNWLRDILRGDDTDGGVTVNARTALTYPPCYYAIQKVAGHLGMMSWSLRETLADRRTREAREHQAYRLLKNPNELYPASVFTEVVSGHAIYRGNGRAYIERDAYMRPLKLWILLPDQTRTYIVDGEKWHFSRMLVDSKTGETRDYKFHDRDMIHIMGFSPDGITGYDVLHLARQSIAMGVAAQRQQLRHFSRDAMPGMLLTAPNGVLLDDDEAKEFLTDFRQAHEGLDNSGKTALLRFGITANKVSQTGRDSQTIESRQHQREEMALWWMLESMIGEGSASYNSEEQRQLAYLKGLPGKMKKRWEEERDRKLLTEREKDLDSHSHRLNPGSLLQADMRSTLTTLRTGIEATIYSPNDAREILGLDAYEGGDEYANPNTATKDSNPPGPTPPAPPPQDVSAETTAIRAAASTLHKRLLASFQSTLQNLREVESKRVSAAAVQAGEDWEKFGKWVARFYAEADWPKTFARVWGELGGEAAAAAEIVAAHRDQLTAATDSASVTAILDAWESQPSEWAAQLAAIDGSAESWEIHPGGTAE